VNPTVAKFLDMPREQLDEIFINAEAGAVPSGEMRGTAIVAGTQFAQLYARLARLFAWQGKVFDIFAPPDSGVLINKISAFSLTFIVAKVYRGPSWMDEKPAIIIDYSKTSFFAKKIRDEIREVEPGIYLGKVWFGKQRILDFALEPLDPVRVSAAKPSGWSAQNRNYIEKARKLRGKLTPSSKADGE
jgi:hypothetical protein